MNNRPSLEELFNRIVELVLDEFSDIVVDVQLRFTSSGAVERLRIFLKDESFVDVWLSASGKYSYHWEQRHVRGLIHRYDNAPHSKWKEIKTFPKHFHDGNEDNVKESNIPDDPPSATNYFLTFIRDFLKKKQRT
ncbi:DUF6516 family protein [Candidatus Bathyarchaeota archaeon]|nr:DUF6516 family protein [Candidatus Bathyarchaeota archaeon]